MEVKELVLQLRIRARLGFRTLEFASIAVQNEMYEAMRDSIPDFMRSWPREDDALRFRDIPVFKFATVGDCFVAASDGTLPLPAIIHVSDGFVIVDRRRFIPHDRDLWLAGPDDPPRNPS